MSKELSELELLTERFAKLLLGEDMSGGKKGVSSALALSNAVTNLAASVFGELWRLGPLPADRRERWNREIGWFLSVVYHIVDFVPSYQSTADGSIREVMVTVPRSDIQINIPALKKLETMLLECLDKFRNAEFWYEERAAISDYDGQNKNEDLYDGSHGEKWWLPTPKIPDDGLTEETRKMLEIQRDSVNQILKAAMAINSQVLSEMEIPDVYWESFPRNGRAVLGETLHRLMTSDNFSADVLLCSLNLSSEHCIVEIKNRIEAACVVWRKKMQTKEQHQHQQQHHHKRSTWSAAFGADDNNKRELYAQRADTILMLLKLRFPGLPQSLLDITKIQHNKDVGQSVLESYSRVLESLAFNVLSRINDVIRADDAVRKYLRSSSLSASASASASARLSFGSEAAESFSKFNSSLLDSPVSQRIYPTPTPSHMHVRMLSVMRTPSPSDFARHRSSAESTGTSSSPSASPSASPSPRPMLIKATSTSSGSKPCSSTNNKTLSDFIGWHSHRHRHMTEYPTPPHPTAATANENEPTHDELVVESPLKNYKGKTSRKKDGKHPHHWSFIENMGSMYSPPSRD